MGLPDELEDDPDVFRMIYKSGHECSRCRDEIMLVDEVFALWVVVATSEGGFQIKYAESDDGDFLYEPQFFCFECWEESKEELFSLDDVGYPPVYDERSVIDCAFCDSAILLGEYFAQIVIGEIRCSKKSPNGEVAYYFHPIGDKDPPNICISCLKLLNDEVVPMWEEGVDQNGECDHGTHFRCWRTGCDGENCQLVDE